MQLEIQAVLEGRVVLEAAIGDAAPAPLGEERRRGLPRRRRKVREVHRLQPEVEPTRVRDVDRGVAEVRPFREQRPHLCGWLQVALVVHARDVVPGHRHDLPHALDRIGDERVLANQVPHGVRGDGPDPGLAGQSEHPPDLSIRVTLHPVLHLDEQALAERVPERQQRAARGGDEAGRGEAPGR